MLRIIYNIQIYIFGGIHLKDTKRVALILKYTWHSKTEKNKGKVTQDKRNGTDSDQSGLTNPSSTAYKFYYLTKLITC